MRGAPYLVQQALVAAVAADGGHASEALVVDDVALIVRERGEGAVDAHNIHPCAGGGRRAYSGAAFDMDKASF